MICFLGVVKVIIAIEISRYVLFSTFGRWFETESVLQSDDTYLLRFKEANENTQQMTSVVYTQQDSISMVVIPDIIDCISNH